MLKIILSMMLIFISIKMIFLSHPLSMGLMVLIQTFLIALISGMLTYSYWFSYILFLTFMGGMLILFIYMTSITSNNLLKINSMNNIISFLFFTLLILIMILLFLNNLNWLNFSFNSEMNNFIMDYLFFNNENKMNLTKLYNEQTFIFMSLMIIYLFITLIAVIKIINIFYGPLRKKY